MSIDTMGQAPTAVKLLIVGHYGVGKTQFVDTTSEIDPLQTEERITRLSADTDDLTSTPHKTTTTVAMDFGRITLEDDLVLCMFGTPGQERFTELWDELQRGAYGALILVDPDPDRLTWSFPVLDLVEAFRLPYVIGVNHFDGGTRFQLDEVREALAVKGHVPVVSCDVRDREESIMALITLIEHLRSPESSDF